MTVNQKVLSCLLGQITIGGATVPVDFLFYTGESESYITFRTSESGSFWGGDAVLDSEIKVIVSIKTKKNYLEAFEKIKEKMINGGFTWQNDSEDMIDKETGEMEKAAQFVIARSEIEWQA